MSATVYQNSSDEWSTPQDLFDQLDAEFHFTVDAAASDENHKCDRYYTKEQDGLVQDWGGEVVWCNPPYGKSQCRLWVEKAYRECCRTDGTVAVLLLPARTDVEYFHRFILHRTEIRFIRGRLKYNNARYNAPFSSMIVIFRGAEKC